MNVGAHVSIEGSIALAPIRASMVGCTTMQIFLSNPRSWKSSRFEAEEIERFRREVASRGIEPVVAHMPYLANLSSQTTVYQKSVKMLKQQVRACNMLGIGFLVLHLGSTMGNAKEKAIAQMINGVLEAAEGFKGMLLLENEAGQKNSVGSDLGELISIYNALSSSGIKTGLCFDTCHAFASGYDLREEKVISEIASSIGDIVKVVHLNDAKFPLGSHLDRHENIGKGKIGIEGFKAFLSFKEFSSKPLILETPYLSERQRANEISLVKRLFA